MNKFEGYYWTLWRIDNYGPPVSYHRNKTIVCFTTLVTCRSSFIASLGSAVASTPIDVIRTRLMNQRRVQLQVHNLGPGGGGGGGGRGVAGGGGLAAVANPSSPSAKIYTGSLDCAIQTVRNEGFRALYKGFIPTWVRMGPWNIIFFITYEQLKQMY